MKIGSILKAARQRKGYSQEELAHKLNINQSDVSKYENDSKEPTMSLFRDWTIKTQAQEVVVAYLCGFDGISVMQNIFDMSTSFVGTILLHI